MNIFCKILKFFGLKKEKCQINKGSETNNVNNKFVKDINKINLTPVPLLDKDKIDLTKFDEEVKKYKKNYQNNKKDIDKLNKDIVDNIPKLNITPVPTLKIDEIEIDDHFGGSHESVDQETKKVTAKKKVRKAPGKLNATAATQPINEDIEMKPDLKKKDKKIAKPKSKKAPKSPVAKRVKKTDKKD